MGFDPPFEWVVRSLMDEVGLTFDEATAATRDAKRDADADGVVDDECRRYSPTVARMESAKGVVSAQVECPRSEAFRLIADRAVLGHLTLDEVAIGVIGGSIRFANAASSRRN